MSRSTFRKNLLTLIKLMYGDNMWVIEALWKLATKKMKQYERRLNCTALVGRVETVSPEKYKRTKSDETWDIARVGLLRPLWVTES